MKSLRENLSEECKFYVGKYFQLMTATTGIVTHTNPSNEAQASMDDQSGTPTFAATSVRIVQNNRRRYAAASSTTMPRVRVFDLK